jgi:RHS repeat-associated protein
VTPRQGFEGASRSSSPIAAGDRASINWPGTVANDGRRSGITRANSGGAPTSYAGACPRAGRRSDPGDGADRISTLTQSLTGTAAVTYTQGYDPASETVSSQVTNSSVLFHDPTTNIAYAADGLDRYATVSGLTPTYDGRQNLFNLSSASPHFTYDTENNLLTGSGPTAMTLVRDALGRIQTKTANCVTETFLYSGSMLVGEYDSAGNILARYVPGPGTDEAVVWYAGAGTTSPQWLHADPLGSTIAWSNSTGGAIGTQAYDPFGQPQAWSGARFAYTGQLMLGEAQLYDYKARAYNPSLGRFMQTDPAGYQSDLNPYGYVGNGPLGLTDPSGMMGCWGCKVLSFNGPTGTAVATTTVGELFIDASRRFHAAVGQPPDFFGFGPDFNNGGGDSGGSGKGQGKWDSPQCTQARRDAAKAAQYFERLANGLEETSLLFTGGTILGLALEAPTLGGDTPVTAAAGFSATAFGLMSVAANGLKAGYTSIANGSRTSNFQFVFNNTAAFASQALAARAHLPKELGDIISSAVSQGLSAINEVKFQCTG